MLVDLSCEMELLYINSYLVFSWELSAIYFNNSKNCCGKGFNISSSVSDGLLLDNFFSTLFWRKWSSFFLSSPIISQEALRNFWLKMEDVLCNHVSAIKILFMLPKTQNLQVMIYIVDHSFWCTKRLSIYFYLRYVILHFHVPLFV